MESTVTIEGKQFGRGRALFPAWRMPLEESGDAGRLTLRELIARVVAAEVEAFRERQEERRTVRALTEREIAAGAARGKIDMGGRDEIQAVDTEQAIAAALLSFEDRLYYVFIDDRQVERLDETVSLHAESRVTFLRLVALAGG